MRSLRSKQLLFVTLACAGVSGCGANSAEKLADSSEALRSAPVGLSLRFANGQATPIALLGNAERFVQELDITESVPSSVDNGITPLVEASGFSALDWSGVTQVEELWIPSLDGTLTRERYFRGARWMNEASELQVVALGANGQQLGVPWQVHAGRDDRALPADDDFVRRFVARQTAFGCAAPGDCSGARFVAEGLMQLRDALDPTQDAQRVPTGTAALRVKWNRLPQAQYDVAVTQQPLGCDDLGYGFQVSLAPVGTPANHHYYLPGEQVQLRVTFKDGSGRLLHQPGQLPTYAEFISGQVTSGLRYLDLSQQTRLYYALKHRESNVLAVLSGPTSKLRTPTTIVDPNAFFGPQVPFATTAVDGFTAVGQTVPPAGIVFGGFANPALWSFPVSDILTFTIPADAEAGTYVAAIKARREFAGEALNRGATLDVQVGQQSTTTFTPKTACTSCHSASKNTSFDRVLHGIDDKRACFGCHASLGIEVDNALDIRVHTVHDRSQRFSGDLNRCATCHLSPPTAPARGVLP